MPNETYWIDRAKQDKKELYKSVDELDAFVSLTYLEVLDSIEKEIAYFYAKYAKENGMTLSDAYKVLNKKEMQVFKKDIKWYLSEIEKLGETVEAEDLLKELNALSINQRITRLQAIQAFMSVKVGRVALKALDKFENGLKKLYKDAYYRTAFTIEQAAGVGSTFFHINEGLVKKTLQEQWSGANFSARLWTNKEKLVRTLKNELVRGFAQGKDVRTITSNLAKQMNVAVKQSSVLVQTESAYVIGKASNDSRSSYGVKKYKILAALDVRTSDICRDQDGKIYTIEEYAPGVTASPFHPRCRSTEITYFDDNIGERIARNENGKTYNVPSNMTYKDWYEKHIKTSNDALIKEKMINNKAPDKKQHKKYREVLGKDVPRTFAQFQEMKYNDVDKFNIMKKKVLISSGKSLQSQLQYRENGKNEFIPSGASFKYVKPIAGKGAPTHIRIVDKLVKKYGGEKDEWSKMVGSIESDKYLFDVHWYQIGEKQYDVKLKHRKGLDKR